MSDLLLLNHALLIFCLALYCLLGASYFWILFQHLRYRRVGLAAEAHLLALPLPSDPLLPDVLVQLPTFNEGKLIARVADAVGKFDWPKERLHIQVLDDSTDGSDKHSLQVVKTLQDFGLDAVLIHRDERAGFKATALAEGLRQSHAEYFAIFDADYIPPKDFLRRCVRPLLHDDRLALVQARCDYLNADANWITYTQRRILDAHFAIEQPARCWSGELMPFNGTCGIWRRTAIDEAGGWQGDTLAEDMDVSYRVQLLGWRTLILTSVAVPGELPATFRSWTRQQFRWVEGSAQVTRKLLPAIWRSRLTFFRKAGSTIHLGGGFFGPLLPVTAFLGAVDFFAGDLTKSVGLLLILLVIGVIGGPIMLQLAGQKLTRGANIGPELLRMPVVTTLRLLAGLFSLGGTAHALLGRETQFLRTPKLGS